MHKRAHDIAQAARPAGWPVRHLPLDKQPKSDLYFRGFALCTSLPRTESRQHFTTARGLRGSTVTGTFAKPGKQRWAAAPGPSQHYFPVRGHEALLPVFPVSGSVVIRNRFCCMLPSDNRLPGHAVNDLTTALLRRRQHDMSGMACEKRMERLPGATGGRKEFQLRGI